MIISLIVYAIITLLLLREGHLQDLSDKSFLGLNWQCFIIFWPLVLIAGLIWMLIVAVGFSYIVFYTRIIKQAGKK